MKEIVEKYIEQNHMLSRGCHVIVGLSGGADSVCLLYMLKELAERFELTIEAVHVHHGLRGSEADEDAVWVEKLCETEGIAYTCYREDVARLAQKEGWTIEEAGRMVRYQAFESQAKQWKKKGPVRIATAHHGNDNSETMLLHLLRGTGIRGLSGIAPMRGIIIRPLLCVSRREIEQYLKEKGYEWREDATNKDTAYTRNYVRQNIMPPIQDMAPKAVEHMLQTAHTLRELIRYMERQADSILSRHSQQITDQEGMEKGIRISQSSYRVADVALKPYILQMAARRAGISVKDWGMVHYEQLDRLFGEKTGALLDLPGGNQAGRAAGEVWLVKGVLKELPIEPCQVEEPGIYEVMPCREVWEFRIEPVEFYKKYEKKCKTPYTKCFDYDKIDKPLCIRSRKAGDYLTLPGGHKQKLQDYMVNEKIPRWERDQIPLLACGSRILWAADGKFCDCLVTEETKQILVLERKIQ